MLKIDYKLRDEARAARLGELVLRRFLQRMRLHVDGVVDADSEDVSKPNSVVINLRTESTTRRI